MSCGHAPGRGDPVSSAQRRPTIDDYAAADAALRGDLDLYCRNLVRIAGRAPGELTRLRWNSAQVELHRRLEEQRNRSGWVRAIILKARHAGVSTYLAARYYHRTSLNLGHRAYILTHEDRATQNLFGMVKIIHDNMPDDYRPATSAANANELRFAGMDGSGYLVGTAHATAGGGRSLTAQLFHGSEVAFWSRAEDHFAAALQIVPSMRGTEIVLESTANGVGGLFYEQWGLAERKQSDFMPIFLPWTLDASYRRDVTTAPDGWEPSAEERESAALYRLDAQQLCWASLKNVELGGEPGKICPRFRQEYPATAAEAFQSGAAVSFIPAEAIMRARRLTIEDATYSFLPRVLGVDVARGGKDRTRIVDRQGRKAGRINVVMHTGDLMQVAHRVMTLLRDNPDIRRSYIDVTGVGGGVYDICRANGFGDRVAGVNFGERAQDPTRYLNRRAEMWGRMQEWLLDPGGADIPDDDEWHRHLASMSHPNCGGRDGLSRYDANSRFVPEQKENIFRRFGFSPDCGDALGLTFAEILSISGPGGAQVPRFKTGGRWMGG